MLSRNHVAIRVRPSRSSSSSNKLQFYVEKRDEKKGASKTSAIFYGDSKGSAKLLEDSQRIQLFDEQNTIDEIYASVANGPIDDALNHRKNINLLVVGASGSGKTFTMKGIVKKLGERVQTVVRHDHHTLVRAVVNNGKKEILNEIVDPDIEGHIYKIYTEGEELRSKKHSKAGHKSSREPLIFTLIIQKTQDLSMNRTFSHSIKLVDTCGNERIGSVDDDRTKGINSSVYEFSRNVASVRNGLRGQDFSQNTLSHLLRPVLDLEEPIIVLACVGNDIRRNSQDTTLAVAANIAEFQLKPNTSGPEIFDDKERTTLFYSDQGAEIMKKRQEKGSVIARDILATVFKKKKESEKSLLDLIETLLSNLSGTCCEIDFKSKQTLCTALRQASTEILGQTASEVDTEGCKILFPSPQHRASFSSEEMMNDSYSQQSVQQKLQYTPNAPDASASPSAFSSGQQSVQKEEQDTPDESPSSSDASECSSAPSLGQQSVQQDNQYTQDDNPSFSDASESSSALSFSQQSVQHEEQSPGQSNRSVQQDRFNTPGGVVESTPGQHSAQQDECCLTVPQMTLSYCLERIKKEEFVKENFYRNFGMRLSSLNLGYTVDKTYAKLIGEVAGLSERTARTYFSRMKGVADSAFPELVDERDQLLCMLRACNLFETDLNDKSFGEYIDAQPVSQSITDLLSSLEYKEYDSLKLPSDPISANSRKEVYLDDDDDDSNRCVILRHYKDPSFPHSGDDRGDPNEGTMAEVGGTMLASAITEHALRGLFFKMIDYGKTKREEDIFFFMVIEKGGPTALTFLEGFENNHKFSCNFKCQLEKIHDILICLCSCVQAFHALAGWNHNDIKLDNLVQRGQGCLPDKVLCTETGKFKMVDKKRLETAYCLIDFDRAEPETSRETSAGRDVGTIYYTPIEVILGLGRKPSSGAGDLFRFGIASLIALVGMRNYEIMRKSLCNCEFHSSFKEEIDRKGKDMLGDILLELWPQPQDKDRNTAVRDELLTSLYVYLVLTYEESCMFAKYLDNVRSVQNGGKESDFFQKFLKTNDMFKWHSGLYSLETGTEMEVIRDSKIFKENVKTRSAKDRNYKCSAKEEERPALKFFKGLLNPDPGLRYPGWKAVTLLAERTKLKDAEQEVSWSLMNILKRSV